jgi:hypothetical protein
VRTRFCFFSFSPTFSAQHILHHETRRFWICTSLLISPLIRINTGIFPIHITFHPVSSSSPCNLVTFWGLHFAIIFLGCSPENCKCIHSLPFSDTCAEERKRRDATSARVGTSKAGRFTLHDIDDLFLKWGTSGGDKIRRCNGVWTVAGRLWHRDLHASSRAHDQQGPQP